MGWTPSCIEKVIAQHHCRLQEHAIVLPVSLCHIDEQHDLRCFSHLHSKFSN